MTLLNVWSRGWPIMKPRAIMEDLFAVVDLQWPNSLVCAVTLFLHD